MILSLVLPAFAAEPQDLTTTLRQALEHSLELRQQVQDVAIAAAEQDLAVAGLVPTVSGLAAVEYGRSAQIDEWRLGSSALLVAEVPLVSANGWLGVRAARLREDAAVLGAAAAREQVLANAGFRYVDLARAEQAVIEAEALQVRSRRLAELARDRVDVGAAAPIEQTRAEILARQDDLRVVTSRTERDAARLRLLYVLGLPVDAEIAVAPGQVAEPPNAPAERPDLAASRSAAEAVRVDQRAAGAGVVPTVSAVGTAGVASSDGEALPVATIGLEASVPIFAGTARSAEVRRLRATAERAELATDDLERQVTIEVAIADAAVATGQESWALAQDARRLAEQEVALAEDRFATGVASNVEVVEAQARLLQGVTAEVDALAAYNLALLDAWQARGRLGELAAE